MRGRRAPDGSRWLDPTQARQGTETNHAAVSMSDGSPEAGRPRGYDRVEVLTADRAGMEVESERPSMRGRLHERQLAGGRARATAWLRPGRGARCRPLVPEAENETLHARLL